MASNSVDILPYKHRVSSGSNSMNDKEDFIKERLRRLEIAYATMAKYPEILNEYVSAVKGEITQSNKTIANNGSSRTRG